MPKNLLLRLVRYKMKGNTALGLLRASAKRLPYPIVVVLRHIYWRLVTLYKQSARLLQKTILLLRAVRNKFLYARDIVYSTIFKRIYRHEYQAAQTHLAKGDLTAARDILEQLTRSRLLTFGLKLNLAHLEFQLENWPRAILLFEESNQARPHDTSFWPTFAAALLKSGKTARACLLVKDYLDTHPHHIAAILDYAHLFREHGLHGDAVGLYQYIRVHGLIHENQAELSGILAAACEYAGYSAEAEKWTADFEKYREKATLEHPNCNYTYRPMNLASVTDSLGDLSSRVDGLLKLQQLGMVAPFQVELFLPPGKKLANNALANLVSKHLKIQSDVSEYARASTEMPWFAWRDFLNFELSDGRVVHNTLACALAEEKWQGLGRNPLFTLSEDQLENGWDTLEQLGIRRTDWFVTLHVREAGYYKEQALGPNALSLHRNADIQTYDKAIEWILQQGGWVIRLGDPSMSAAPFNHKKFIDYARSSVRSDEMDIFLIAASRYLLATNSGPMCLAAIFGTITGVTNYLPLGMPPLSPRNLFLPRMLWWREKRRFLTFSEMLNVPFRMANRHHLFALSLEKLGIDLIPNTSDEILALTQELHCAAANVLPPAHPNEDRLREIFRQHNCHYISRISPAFLNKHAASGGLNNKSAPELQRRWDMIGENWLQFSAKDLVASAQKIYNKDVESARGLCQVALHVDSQDIGGRSLLAQCFCSLGEPDQAIAILDKLCLEIPDSVDITRQLSMALWAAKRHDEALLVHHKLLALAPNSLADWIELGHQLNESGNHKQAISAYSEPAQRIASKKTLPVNQEGVLAAACEYAGDPSASRRWAAQWEKRRYRMFKHHKHVENLPAIVSLGRLGTRIGDIAARFDLLYKGNATGLIGPSLRLQDMIIEGASNYANNAYVDLWREHLPFSQNLTNRNLPWYAYRDLGDIPMKNGQTLYYPAAYSVFEEAWFNENRPPVIQLPPLMIESGWKILSELGVKDGDWFVTLHVREGGFHNEAEHSDARHRSAAIADYEKAVDFIIDMGGWVIRLGDSTMTPLPFVRPKLVDYAHSHLRSPKIDLFLMSQCRYLIGTNSGPLAVCTSFGVPCGITNFLPVSHTGCSPRNLLLPKMLWHETEQRYIALKEMLTAPIVHANRWHIYRLLEKEFGIVLKNNSPDELLAFTQEMHGWSTSDFRKKHPLHHGCRDIFKEHESLYITPFSDTFVRQYESEGYFKKTGISDEIKIRWETIRNQRYSGLTLIAR